MQRFRWERYIGHLILLLGLLASAGAHGDAPPPIALIPQDGFNLEIVDQVTPHYVVVQLATPAHNWFAGTFTNLPTDKEVTIGLSMAGNDTRGNAADVTKWVGLMPVMTYADPTQYETYEWFQKDAQGRWVSGDPFKQGEEKFAGMGKTPEQSVIPKDIAEQFLSQEGTYWQAWREVDKAEAVPGINVFRVTQRFAYPTATVAMRVPYTYTYLQQFIARLQMAKMPGVFVDELGETPEKRKLLMLRLEDPSGIQANKEAIRSILIDAAEHATEHAASWAAHGLLAALLDAKGKPLRRNMAWLILLIHDPDGNAHSQFDRLTDIFCDPYNKNKPPEVFAFAQYFIKYVDDGKTIDLSLTLHNVEANECENIYCPFIDRRFPNRVIIFNEMLFDDLKKEGYVTPATGDCPDKGWMNFRLYGWCALHFGTFDLAYEVNDRYPKQRLTLAALEQIGSMMGMSIGKWLNSESGNQWHNQAREVLRKREEERKQYLTNRGYDPKHRSKAEILMRAY